MDRSPVHRHVLVPGQRVDQKGNLFLGAAGEEFIVVAPCGAGPPPRHLEHDLFERHGRPLGAALGQGRGHPSPPAVVGLERVDVGVAHRLVSVEPDDGLPTGFGAVSSETFPYRSTE